MEKFLVEFNEYEPKYIQIANNIKKLITDKHLVGGEKLQPLSGIAQYLKVNNHTNASRS